MEQLAFLLQLAENLLQFRIYKMAGFGFVKHHEINLNVTSQNISYTYIISICH